MTKFNDPIESAIKNLGPTLRAANGPREFRPWAKAVLWTMFGFAIAALGAVWYARIFLDS